MSASRRLEEPILVFISSAQQEFESFRQELKQTIDSEPWSKVIVMRGCLIENQRGPVVHDDIRRKLDVASIYVGIFGKQLRDWPVAEFRYAKVRGLPQLIYKYERGLRPGRPPKRRRTGPRSRVDSFLKTEVEDVGIRIRGPYRDLKVLSDIIMKDLAILSVQMVRENADIRKRLYTGMP